MPGTASTSDKVIVEHNIMVPMRDGIRLATDIYRPDKPGQFPVLLLRLPYGKELLGGLYLDPYNAVQRDYVVVLQGLSGLLRVGR